ncbi:hypothetical protein [Polaribacter cellanae]|uniref:DUF1574 domain-containing protein n=1 Tax=Polaribacter cellanae TaxID=2818493 RepID=A0A975CSC0_9FLAO|nr:hypothetical protein [Polaribacter cellanae]QTE23052.1 hypothetical protein J3359_01905 [Polaribacter cellanae]
MNKFLKHIAIIISVLLLLITVYVGETFFANYNHKIDYPAAIIDKYKRLDSLKDTSKIIIAGGSSSSYSINSKLLGKTFLKPVINTSLAMSLGSRYHLNLTKKYLTKGDVILYIPEYEYYYGKENGDDFLYTTLFYAPAIFKDFTQFQKKSFFKKAIRLSTKFYISLLKKKEATPTQYKRESYNYLGDNISLVSVNDSKIKAEKINRYQKLKSKEISRKFVTFLQKMNLICKEKDVQLIITFPPLEKSQFDNHFLQDINELRKETNLIFVGDPTDYLYGADLFYDSSYHLNGEGRKIRTKKLIETLKNKL